MHAVGVGTVCSWDTNTSLVGQQLPAACQSNELVGMDGGVGAIRKRTTDRRTVLSQRHDGANVDPVIVVNTRSDIVSPLWQEL